MSIATGGQRELFNLAPILPDGLIYERNFVNPAEEMGLLESIAQLPFREARFQQYTARRQVVRFGFARDDEDSDFPALDFPDFLGPLRRRISAWLKIPEARFVHTLITRYDPGTPIGWHRDAPHFETVVGISLEGRCRMRFRPLPRRSAIEDSAAYRTKAKHGVNVELEPRSAYVMTGNVRWNWQHHIPPTKELRYSITLRTLVEGGHALARRVDRY